MSALDVLKTTDSSGSSHLPQIQNTQLCLTGLAGSWLWNRLCCDNPTSQFMQAMLFHRQQAQAAGEAMQADSTDAAAPVARRATADMGTQCMLDDSHPEPATAHTHDLHRAHAAANTRVSVHNSSVESVGLLGAASAAQHRKAPQGLIPAHDHPTRGVYRPTWHVDRPMWQAESGMLTKHALPVVHHSDLEGAVTEDEASQKQAEATSLLGIDRPHVVSWDHSPQPARQHPHAAGVSQATHGVSPDDVSISVTAGGHEYLPAGTPAPWTDMHQGRASSRFEGPGGAGAPRGAVEAAGGQSPYDVRSPLHSIHEEHGIRPRSLRPSSTGEYHLGSYGDNICLLRQPSLPLCGLLTLSMHLSPSCAPRPISPTQLPSLRLAVLLQRPTLAIIPDFLKPPIVVTLCYSQV